MYQRHETFGSRTSESFRNESARGGDDESTKRCLLRVFLRSLAVKARSIKISSDLRQRFVIYSKAPLHVSTFIEKHKNKTKKKTKKFLIILMVKNTN